jgi:hypothetical protein
MSGDPIPNLTLRSPPHYGRRAAWAALAALALLGLSFCIDEAASNQLAPSEMPAAWTRYLAGVALYYAIICAYRWLRRRSMASKRP